MRYARRGGYTPAEQQRRERLRMEAAGRFARGDTIGEIARDLRVSIAGVACYRPGDRPHLFFKLRPHRRRKGEPKSFTWAGYRDLITRRASGR
jgi:hypothetical protein